MSLSTAAIERDKDGLRSNPAAVCAIAGFLASLPLGWITLFDAGGLSVRPAHFAFVAVALTIVLVAFRAVQWQFVLGRGGLRDLNLLTVLYAAYLGTMLFALLTRKADAGFRLSGELILLKELANFTMFLSLSYLIGCMSDRNVAGAVYVGAGLGIACFLVAATLIFAAMGGNFFGAYIAALRTGDPNNLRYSVYVPIFNYFVDTNTSESVVLVNTIVSSFVFYVFAVWAYRPVAGDAVSERWAIVICWGVTVISIVLIVGTTNRLNCAALLAAVVFASCFKMLTATSARTFRNRVVLMLFALVMLALLSVSAFSLLGIDNMLRERFGWEKLASDSRWPMYRSAIEASGDQWLFGHGVGATVSANGKDFLVHNLWLASWYEAGIPALAASVLFFGYIIWVWMLNIRNIVRSQYSWRIPVSAAWVLVLPLLPIFKLTFYGASLQLVDWCVLAVFFACLRKNHRLMQVNRVATLDRASVRLGVGNEWVTKRLPLNAGKSKES